MSITVEHVSKRFGTYVALDTVSVDIADGTLTSILGPSGSGKSTLLRVIAGLEQPDQGKVSIFGEDMTHLPPQRRGIGFVFQHYAAFRHMTVRENVAFGLRVRKRPKAAITQRVNELLDLVQLTGLAERYPGQLSGGQRQRMGLARALAVEPKVMLLDEPFGALDARVRAELRSWLRRLHDEVHVTTVLVTHDQEEAMEISDHVVVMNQAHVEQTGTPRELYDHPESEFVMSFLGHANRIGGRLVRPHDLHIFDSPGLDRYPAIVERTVFLGFEVRATVRLEDGLEARVQLTGREAEELELRPGQIVYVDVSLSRTFPSAIQSAAASAPVLTGVG